jgi:hypothetical protein
MSDTHDFPRGSISPELLERLRNIGLRLDREGRLWHGDVQMSHPRLCQALLRWMDVLPDGRSIVRLDEHRYAYLQVEDAHLLTISARWQGDRAWLRLNDGSEEELDGATLTRGPDHALYCRVRHGRLEARFTTAAYYVIAERIREQGDQFVLDAAGRRFPIPLRQRHRQNEPGAS